MRCNHLDVIALGEVMIQAVAIVGFIANQPCWQGVEETMSENSFHQLAFVWRSTFHTNGERKTVIIGESDDLGPLWLVWALQESCSSDCKKLVAVPW